MPKTKNPAAGKRQGLGIDQGYDRPIYTSIHSHLQAEIDVARVIAARCGVSLISVRAQLDAFGIGGGHG